MTRQLVSSKTTNGTVESAKIQNTQEVAMNTINLEGKSIDVRRPEQNILSFGPKDQRNKAHLNSFGATMGFMNAIKHLDLGYYPVCVRGFHFKIALSQIPMTWETPNDQPRGYVNFDMLTDETYIKLLERHGIKADPEKTGWLALKVVKGRIFPWFRVAPKTHEELLDGRTKEEVEVFEFQANDRAWMTMHKQNGLELAMLLRDEQIRVICNVPAKAGFEWQFKALDSKLNELIMPVDEYEEVRSEKISNMQAQRANRLGAHYVATREPVREAAVEAAANMIVIVNGEEQAVSVTDLVKSTVCVVRGNRRLGGRMYLTTEDNVLAAVQNAARLNACLEVVG